MHTFMDGQSVMVLNTTMSGTVIIEGVATIVECVPNTDEVYEVIFDGDDLGQECTRFVDPLAQNETAKYVAKLNDPQ